MAKLLLLTDMFINNLEINSKITFKYNETHYRLQKTKNKYELHNEASREVVHTFYKEPYDFFKLVKFDEQSVYDIYENIEIIDKSNVLNSSTKVASTKIDTETFIKLEYALFKYEKKRYMYYRKNGTVNLNCIFPLNSYFEEQFETVELFFESEILGKNNEKIIDLFEEIIIDEISLY